MRVFVIANTKFGFKNRSLDQIDYFNNFFIPYLQKNASKNDILIHLGNILNNRTSINIRLFNDIYDIFFKLSNILNINIIENYNDIYSSNIFNKIKNISIIKDYHPIENILLLSKNTNKIDDYKYLFFNKNYLESLEDYSNYEYCFNGYFEYGESQDNIYNIYSPYQLNKKYNNNGFYILDTDTNEIQFIENDYSPIYREITIEHVDQLKILEEYKKDIIDIKTTSYLINRKEVSIFLSNYKINNITYLDEDEKEEDIDLSYINNSNIRNILINQINNDNPEIIDDLNRVFKIHDKKINNI